MTKKNILTAAVSLSLVACLSIGATLAYFTDQTETVQNTFTTGKVNIDVIDRLPDDYADENQAWKADQPGGEDTPITYEHVQPGDDLDKIVGVELLSGSEDSWLGMKVVVDSADANLESGIANVIMTAKNAGWELVETTPLTANGTEMIFAYNEAVSYNSKFTNTYELFNVLHIPETWGNEIASANFSITVQGFAMQAEHVTYAQFREALSDTAANFETYVEPTTPVEP